MENIEITSNWELLKWSNEVFEISEVKKLIEWVKAFSEHILTSVTQDFSHLNKTIEHWWEEYNIKII